MGRNLVVYHFGVRGGSFFTGLATESSLKAHWGGFTYHAIMSSKTCSSDNTWLAISSISSLPLYYHLNA